MQIHILLLFLLISFSVQSQDNTSARGTENYEELKVLVEVKTCFDDKDVEYIDVGYFDKKASYVKMYINKVIYLGDIKENSRYFDLSFEGDSCVLAQNYPSFRLPATVFANTQNMYGQGGKNGYNISRVSVYQDSTIYFFSKNDKPSFENTIWGFPAKYLGNTDSMQKEISKRIVEAKVLPVVDSICVFEIVITKRGELKAIQLVGGNKSIFSDIVQKYFLADENRYFDDGKSIWKPAIIYSTGRPIETKLKVFAKLCKEGSVVVKFPKTLRNFTGN